MAKTVIVNNESKQIASIYPGEPSQGRYGGPWGDPGQFSHIQIPEGLDDDTIAVANKKVLQDKLDQDGNRIAVMETVQVALMDENGDPVLDEDGQQVYEAQERQSVDQDGNPVFEQEEVETSELEIVPDADKVAAKLQSSREEKLQELRKIRDEKLLRVDVLVNLAVLYSWTASEKTELRNYRQALLDVTEDYKDDMHLLDDLEISAIQWPEEPSEF
jgi:hypothetical protein